MYLGTGGVVVDLLDNQSKEKCWIAVCKNESNCLIVSIIRSTSCRLLFNQKAFGYQFIMIRLMYFVLRTGIFILIAFQNFQVLCDLKNNESKV